jgi:hypothetical protein
MRIFLIKLIKFLLIGLFPFVLLFLGYIINDPYKVIYKYDDFSKSKVTLNKDYVSTETLFRNRGRYESFIFGSSRTMAYKPNIWRKYIGKKSKILVFDASCESIFGIYKKIYLLDSLNIHIKNALIILCKDYTFSGEGDSDGHLFMKHYYLTNKSYLDFHFCFFKAYLSPKFLLSYYTYLIFGKTYGWMDRYIQSENINFDPRTNEMRRIELEKEIYSHPEKYYNRSFNDGTFFNRPLPVIDSVPRISPKQKKMLLKIKNILLKHKTNYKVILSPLYIQITYNQEDLDFLKSVFNSNLYNFSGVNKYTASYLNYYENSHYTAKVGSNILKDIYLRNN